MTMQSLTLYLSYMMDVYEGQILNQPCSLTVGEVFSPVMSYIKLTKLWDLWLLDGLIWWFLEGPPLVPFSG